MSPFDVARRRLRRKEACQGDDKSDRWEEYLPEGRDHESQTVAPGIAAVNTSLLRRGAPVNA